MFVNHKNCFCTSFQNWNFIPRTKNIILLCPCQMAKKKLESWKLETGQLENIFFLAFQYVSCKVSGVSYILLLYPLIRQYFNLAVLFNDQSALMYWMLNWICSLSCLVKVVPLWNIFLLCKHHTSFLPPSPHRSQTRQNSLINPLLGTSMVA